MSTFNQFLSVSFGASKSGLASSLNVAVTDAGGVSRLTTATFAEETDAAGNATTGTYGATVSFDTSWTYPLKAKFTITGQAGVVAVATYGLSPAPNGFLGGSASNAPLTNILNGVAAGNVAAVTGDVGGSLHGNVQGNVQGSVASVAGAVILPTTPPTGYGGGAGITQGSENPALPTPTAGQTTQQILDAQGASGKVGKP